MKTGFLIVNYNDHETTTTLLENIKNYDILDSIVVVDNASSDDSVKQLEKFKSSKIAIISNSSNKGYGSGINFGSKYLIEKLGECKIIVSNSDIEIAREEDIIFLVKNFPEDAGIVGPVIKEHSGLNRGWKIPTAAQDCLLNLVGIEKIFRRRIMNYSPSYYEDALAPVEALSGCFFIIDSLSLQKANYYDENVFLYYEENIMARKLEKIGKRTYVNTQVEVFHNHSVSIDKSINRTHKFRELKKSQEYFQAHYNHAGMLAMVMLKLTEEISFFFLKFMYLFK